MPSPLISVIIPAYNNGQYLLEAIQSVLAQDYPNIELIVIDDGSTDDTRQLLDACADSLTWQYQENAGIAGARNAGYRLARGDFIAFLDADDVYTPGRLRLQMSAFDDEPALDCVQGHMQQFVSPELPVDFAQGIRGQTAAVIPAPLASTTLIRRTAYDRVGPWDQALKWVSTWIGTRGCKRAVCTTACWRRCCCAGVSTAPIPTCAAPASSQSACTF